MPNESNLTQDEILKFKVAAHIDAPILHSLRDQSPALFSFETIINFDQMLQVKFEEMFSPDPVFQSHH